MRQNHNDNRHSHGHGEHFHHGRCGGHNAQVRHGGREFEPMAHGGGRHGRPGPGGGRRGGGEGRGGQFGGRARRGEARYIIMDALKSGAKHGYEIIKTLEEKSDGQYSPSPGTVYPTLQYLEELGMVQSDQDGDRKVFSLTEEGLKDLSGHEEEIEAFWARWKVHQAPEGVRVEIGFLREEVENLVTTIRTSIHPVIQRGDQATIKHIRATVESCRAAVRDIISNASQETRQQEPEQS